MKLVHLGGFIIKKFVTIQGHMNEKKINSFLAVLVCKVKFFVELRRLGSGGLTPLFFPRH